MDEEIEASPTSQRKRKKLSRRHTIKKMSTTGEDNLELVVNDQKVDDTIEDSDHLFHNKMWQSAYLLEANDRVQFVPKNCRSHRSLGNEFRMSAADFLSLSQLCATRATNLNENEDSQWDVTESQFRKVDDAIKEFHESEIRIKQIDNSVPVDENIGDALNVTARSDETFADVGPNDQSIGSGNVGRNSSKRRSSVLDSILSEWSSPSPVKIHKTQNGAVQLSPKFIFNRKRCKRTYCRKQFSNQGRNLANDFQRTEPTTSAVYGNTAVGNIRPELGQKPIGPPNDDDDDFDESMNIVDNIQNLSKFFSQSFDPALVGNNDDATESTAMDLTEFRTSLDGEEEFLGFDGKNLTGGLVSITLPEFFLKCDRKFSPLTSITLPERFDEFGVDSDSSCTSRYSPIDNSDQLLLMEDDDIFANYQTQQHIPREEVGFEEPVANTSAIAAGSNGIFGESGHRKLINGGRCSETNSVGVHTEAASKIYGRRGNVFEDIEKEFDVTSNLRKCPFTESSTSTSSPGFSIEPQFREVQHQPIFAGFSTVTGKQIPVSSALISEKMSIFENTAVGDDELMKVGNWINDNHQIDKANSSLVNKHPAFTGFGRAGGNIIPVSAELISKKVNIFESVKVTGDEFKQMNNRIEDERRNVCSVFNEGDSEHRMTGFASAREKRISVPVNVAAVIGDERSKMGAWMGGETSDDDFFLPSKQCNLEPNLTSMFRGFTTAGGSHIPVSSELISKKVNIFDSVNVTEDDIKKMNKWIDDERRNDVLGLNSKPSGFATARGKQIPVSSTMVSKNKNILQSVTVTGDELNDMDTWITDRDVIDEANYSLGHKQSNFDLNPNLMSMGFTTAGGKNLPMSSAQVSKRITIFDDMNVTADELQKMNHWINDAGHSNSNTANASSADRARKIPISRSLFSKPVHNIGDNQTKQRNSTELFREVTNTPQREADNVPKKLPVDTFIKPSPMRKMSMMNSLRQLETLKENAVTKPILSVDENHSGMSDTTSTPTSSRSYVCVTPTNNQKTYSQIGRESAAAIMEDDELTFANPDVQLKEHTPGFVSGFLAELTASTPINKAENYRNRLKQRRLVEKFDAIAREDYVEANIHPGTIKLTVSPHVKASRTLAIEEQRRSIAQKTNVRAVPSSLFVNKLTSAKVNWKEFVEHTRPVNKPVTSTSLTNNVLNVTADNATKFKFNAWDHYSDEFCRENITGIHLQDDIVVMMDENCQVGLTEISTAFLSCPSVDPKLIHDKWIENHMRWIVVKLAAMERSFPHRFARKVLTLENLMLQMKYRYEREIDRVERSAIRKICEMDDVPEKRMILFVAGITRSSNEYDVELSDGWYSLTSTLDYGMKKLVNEGKITVGTKLVIQGANTVNLVDGCHPLEVTANVKLRIHANSTRRATWDSRLGYCANPQPFKISLRSVWGSGGNISKLRICVLRVYPVVYIDPKNLADVHSEKVERRRSITEERQKTSLLEKVINDISRDIEQEEKSARFENRPSKIVKLAEISSITDPAYLCELLENDKDPERIEGELTNTQKTMVSNYKEKANCLRSEEINTRVKQKLAAVDKGQRKFVPLLRFKVTDEMFFDKTAIVTVWKPTEDIHSLIKEGSVFDLTGSSSRGVSFFELQIYAGKSAIFRKVNVDTRVPQSLLRRHISISEILSIEQLALNELDTTGFVVHVGESLHSLQPVYIADSDHNVVCVSFWQSVKDFAYEDVVQPKRFLAIKNLQWRRKTSNSKPIPCTYATEYTLFTENPQSAELSSAIATLKEKFANVDVDEFIETCMEKVRSFKSMTLSTPIHSNISSLSMQSSISSLQKTPTDFSPQPGRSSLSTQSRIELLSKYGDGMPTPPLKIDVLSKSFKLPVMNS